LDNPIDCPRGGSRWQVAPATMDEAPLAHYWLGKPAQQLPGRSRKIYIKYKNVKLEFSQRKKRRMR
jgi:hypothetical protein